LSIGRFTQTDPLLGNRPFKHYSYGSNNPVSRVDPMGLQDFASKAQEEAFWNSVGGAEGGMAVPDHVMKSWTGYQQNAWAFVKDKQWHWKYGMGGGAGRMKDRWYAYAENDLDDQAYVAAIESLNTQERKAYMARLLREAQGNKNIYLHDIMAEFVPGAGIEHFFSGRDFSGNPVSQSEAFAGLLMELPWAKAGKAFTALRGAGRAAKAAGAVGKSGGKPIRIALGLAQHPGHTSPGVLGRFGRHVDALTWDQWHSAGLVDRYNKSLQDLLTEVSVP
jgi:hypothetical protein